MIRGFFNRLNRSFKNLKNVIFHVKLLSPTLNTFFFKCCLTLEVNNRTIGDNNGTIEQYNNTTIEQFYKFSSS